MIIVPIGFVEGVIEEIADDIALSIYSLVAKSASAKGVSVLFGKTVLKLVFVKNSIVEDD
jgi:hypothetical protein